MAVETKVNKDGETMWRTPGGNAWTTKDPNRVTAIYTPISGENAGQRVSLKANGTKTVAPQSGITTSSDAENRGKSANETLNNLSPAATGKEVENPLTAMYKRLSELQTQLAAAKEKEAQADVKAKLDATASAEEAATSGKADLNAATDALAGNGTTENIQDPVIRALTDKTIANTGIITNQMNTLAQYREQFNEYTQQDIDSIARTAERSIQRQTEENQRTTDAMRFAGVLAGRAQFSPVPEQSIIHEVIQEGLDKIEVINEKKNTAIREARKAEAEFNIDAFEQQAELAKEYNNEIESTISAMNAQVRQAEADERARIEFRNTQEERTSLILAEELVDATPQQVMEAAVANGINAGLLMKAVNDAKFTKEDRIFTQKDNALSLEAKQASINASNRSNQPDSSTEDFTREESALLRQAGLDGASYDEKITFLNMAPTERSAKIKEVQDEKKAEEDMSVSDFISNLVGTSSFWTKDEFPDRLKQSAKSFGIDPKGVFNDKEGRNFLGVIVENLKTSYPDISDAEIKEYLKQIPSDATTEEITAYLSFARTGVK